MHIATPLHATNSDWQFGIDANRNLYAVVRQGSSGRVDLLEMTAASNYTAFGVRTATAQAPLVAGNHEFEIAPNGDLFVILKQGGGSGRTEVHALSKASTYQSYVAHAATPLGYTSSNWEFEVDGARNVWGILRGPVTGTGKTEVHIMSPGVNNYGTFVHQSGTELGLTDGSWVFDVSSTCQLAGVARWGGATTQLHLAAPTPQFACGGGGVPLAPTEPAGTCGPQTGAGNDVPFSKDYDLFKTSGTFSFSRNTYTVKDRILVSYQGAVLHDTGCVSGNQTVNLTYAGSSRFVNVTVYPNCEGSTGTAWDFIVGCP